MTTIIFDTLDFSKRAQEAGFTKEQAEFQAREIASGVEKSLATKQDLKDLELRMIIKFGGMLIVAMSVYPIISRFLSAPGVTQ